MVFYARLKPGISDAPRYGVYLYPGDPYKAVEDRYRRFVEQDERVEILTVEEMSDINQQTEQLIDDTVFGHWRRSEKTIAGMTDKVTLGKILAKAKANDKAKIAELAQDRIDELTLNK